MLYPSVTLSGARLYADERELQLACVRAYNEWLAEFCDGGEGRLIGQAIVPTTGVDDAVAEVHAALALGHRGVVISAFPNGTLDAQPEDARVLGAGRGARTARSPCTSAASCRRARA